MSDQQDDKYRRFQKLGFDDFRKMAKDPSLSVHERIGFPDEYRAGKDDAILRDIVSKLPLLAEKNQIVLDIGPGCGSLAFRFLEHCRKQSHRVIAVDAEEVLNHLPDDDFIEKLPAYFPNCPELFQKQEGKINVVVAYSIFHYVFTESSFFGFLDRALSLLAGGGEFLIGDIPNVSMRKRFFSSEAGIRFHQNFTGRNERPTVEFNTIEHESIDDSVILAILARARAAGFEAYVLPQNRELPMANRREDILIRRP